MKKNADFDALLGYQVQKTYLHVMADARRTLDPHGLTPAKLTALMLIGANPGCDQTALGKALSINRSSAMKLVNGLVARDLIERRSGRNLRTNALHLLPHGEQQLEAMTKRLRDADRRVSRRLTDAERATLFTLLRKLATTPHEPGDTD